MMKDLVLFGIQGVGKGTQARKILGHYDGVFKTFEPGSIFRALKATPNSFTDYIKQIYDAGDFFSAEFLKGFFHSYLETLGEGQYLLLDGFPRSKEQMEMFLDRMQQANRDFIAIEFTLPEEEAIARQAARRICKQCGTIHNLLLTPDLQVCSKCSGALEQRLEDTPDLIKKRLQFYYDEIVPMIKVFEGMGVVHKIDGNRSIDEIFADVQTVIDNS